MPPVTQALIVVNVAVFLLQMATDLPLIEWFALWPVSSGLEAGPGFEPWQLISYSFLHGGVAHILFNMFALYMFGGEIERLFGSRFYLAYYFACVLSAAVTRSEEHTSELQSQSNLVCRLLLEKKKCAPSSLREEQLLVMVF